MRAVAKNDRVWFIVDDQEEVKSFVSAFVLASKKKQQWRWLQPAACDETLLKRGNSARVAGALIDIDLTVDTVIKGTGLALAQGIRAKQKGKFVSEYPLIRFANPEPIARFVGSDPGSNDLFDLLISKDEARKCPAEIVRQCAAVREIYNEFSSLSRITPPRFAELCNVSLLDFELLGDARLFQRIATGLSATKGATHVGAGSFIRTFLVPDGLLISEELLAVRLGVDKRASPAAWKKILRKIERAKYKGIGSDGFDRWWARGVERFWLSACSDKFLQELTNAERVMLLSKSLKLKTLKSLRPKDARYWRLCTISRERGKFVPIDPRNAVKMISAVSSEPWLEPEQASPEVAAMNKGDKRLDRADLKRLKIVTR
jgi:hypothetical protein